MRLVYNWDDAWRWFSMQAMALALAVEATWTGLPPGLIAYLPDSLNRYVVITLLVVGMLGRLVDQTPKRHWLPD